MTVCCLAESYSCCPLAFNTVTPPLFGSVQRSIGAGEGLDDRFAGPVLRHADRYGQLTELWGFPLDAYGWYRAALISDSTCADAVLGLLRSQELLAAQECAVADLYTDVASVKVLPVARARALGCDLGSFVPGHPLAGRERHGPAAAQADLFLGRTWALCPLPENSPAILMKPGPR